MSEPNPAERTANSLSSDGDAAEPIVPWFDWTDRDQRVLLGLAAVVFLLIGWNWARWQWSSAPLVEIDRLPENRYAFRVELNQATWVEWMQLEGIGEILARRIVEYRQQHGAFQSIDDLSQVPGVGTATLNTIRPWIVCSDCKIVTIDGVH